MNLIDIKNFSFKDTNTIFFNLNLKIDDNSFIILVGPNNSGKTTFLKLLSGKIKSNIVVDDSVYVNKKTLFFSKTVLDEIMLNTNSKKDAITYLEKFNIKEVKDLSPSELSIENIIILKLIISLLKKPKLLLLDNIFSCFEKERKKEIIKILNNISKENKFGVIYTSNNLNDSIYFDELYIINNKTLSQEVPKTLSLPFTLELSEKLLLYGLIKEEEYDLEELAKKLC